MRSRRRPWLPTVRRRGDRMSLLISLAAAAPEGQVGPEPGSQNSDAVAHTADASSNKMMQLIIVARREPLCHWLNALAIAGADQPRHVKGTHLPTGLVTQTIQERLHPHTKAPLSNQRSP